MTGTVQSFYRGRIMPAFVLIGLLLPAQQSWGRGSKSSAVPDYTKGDKPDSKLVRCMWALGPTGAYGHIHRSNARQILIDQTTEGSPADGVLQKDDVILGIVSPKAGQDTGGGKFTLEARHSMAIAIEEAEKKANRGKLVLNIWRKGKVMPVTLTLKVLGSYSPTAPWDCEKTDALIEQLSQVIMKRGLFQERRGKVSHRGGIDTKLDALGLLATGEAKYMPELRKYARAVAKGCEHLDIMSEGNGISSWNGGYTNLLLTEYYLATRDEEVMPGIKALSTYMAMGRSGVGTYSHGMSYIKMNGLFGPPSAYGAMNQCSITCIMSLALAQKCGLKTKEIDDAVRIGTGFLRWYVDKGTIPYGDHTPAYKHDNNGRNSQAAVLFDLVGDKAAAEYFTRSAVASWQQREAGHTGHYFGWQWGALGAGRGGPKAAHSFMRNTRWYTEMERRTDGDCRYQPQLSDPGRYPNWSTAGQRLMQYCLPRKKIYISGKGGSSFPTMTAADVKESEDAGWFQDRASYTKERVAKMSVKQLLAALSSWSLVVRGEAAKELGTRDEDVSRQLIAMLDSPNRYARYGACVALRYAGRKSEKAVDVLIRRIENDRDMTFRYFALEGLTLLRSRSVQNGLGSVPRKAVPALLKLAAAHDPEQDATRKITRLIAEVLFYGGRTQPFTGFFPNGKGIETVDKALLIPALKAMLVNPNGAARSQASSTFQYLTKEDLEQLWGDIYYAAKNQAPSGVMFAFGGRKNSVCLLADHRFEEAKPLAYGILTQGGWGKFARVPAAFDALSNYGTAVEEYMPQIEKEWKDYQKRKAREVANCRKAYQKILDNLDKTFDLKSVKPYVEKAAAGRR
ncbi:MAG: DUF6288 domain-containing protein [Planctomycetota bacterium]|jgi:hypothetical protein